MLRVCCIICFGVATLVHLSNAHDIFAHEEVKRICGALGEKDSACRKVIQHLNHGLHVTSSDSTEGLHRGDDGVKEEITGTQLGETSDVEPEGWPGYVNFRYLSKSRKKQVFRAFPRFNPMAIDRWNSTAKMIMKGDKLLWFNAKLKTAKTNATEEHCQQVYDKTMEALGSCGGFGGSGGASFDYNGCPDEVPEVLREKYPSTYVDQTKDGSKPWKTRWEGAPVPCVATLEKPLWQRTRVALRNSTADGSLQEFAEITVSGKQAVVDTGGWTGEAVECKARLFIKLAVCQGCDNSYKQPHNSSNCPHGLVRYDLQSELDSKNMQCKEWYSRTVTWAGVYFGIDRMEAMLDVMKNCAGGAESHDFLLQEGSGASCHAKSCCTMKNAWDQCATVDDDEG